MKNYELLSFPNGEALARRVAEDWTAAVADANRSGHSQSVALSGGRVARRFFAATSEWAAKRNVSFANVHIFWADERCVPPTDPESNFALAHQLLLKPLGVPPSQIHRIRGEAVPELAAQEAAEELRRFVPANNAGIPVVDLIFLGMGEDGHVASLFPGEPVGVQQQPDLFRAVAATKPPPRRVTIGYTVIGVAKEVWVLASGAGKDRALKDSVSRIGQTPLAQVIKRRPLTRIYTDVPI